MQTFFSSSGGEFMALLSIYHIIQTTRNLFTIASHKHIADHQIFDHKWLHYWQCTIRNSPFVTVLLQMFWHFSKCAESNPREWRAQSPTPDTENRPIRRYLNGRDPKPSPINKLASVKICLHLYEKEGRRNLILQKSLSVYKPLHTVKGLVQWVFN